MLLFFLFAIRFSFSITYYFIANGIRRFIFVTVFVYAVHIFAVRCYAFCILNELNHKLTNANDVYIVCKLSNHLCGKYSCDAHCVTGGKQNGKIKTVNVAHKNR